MQVRTRALAAFILAAAVPAAAEDLTIVSKTSEGGPPTTTTSYLAADHAHMVQGNGHEVIVDFKTGQMTVLDGQKKEYFVITRQDMDQLKARLQQQMNSPEMQRAQEKMKSLPPDIQKRMQAAMGGMASSVDVSKSGPPRKIAGYTCEPWTITMGQFSKTEECLSSDVPVPVQSWDMYRDFSDSMRSMMGAMGPMSKGITQMQEKMKDLRGYPLAVNTTLTIMGRPVTTTSEVVEIKKGPIPASAWAIPAGYTKVDNPMMKGMPAR